MGLDLTQMWSEAVSAVRAEVRRWQFPVLALDEEDLVQEGALAAIRCARSFDPKRGSWKRYVATATRNRMIRLAERSRARRAVPTDSYGRPMLYNGVLDLTGEEHGGDLLAELEGADIARHLREQLDGQEWDLLAALAEGAEEGARRVGRTKQVARSFARARAEIALVGAVYPVGEGCMVDIPATPTEALPECHARGTKPQGYGLKDPLCEDCPDKFTCLPESRAAGLVNGEVADGEVDAVLGGWLSYGGAIVRMKARREIRHAGAKAIPETLSVAGVERPEQASVPEAVLRDAEPPVVVRPRHVRVEEPPPAPRPRPTPKPRAGKPVASPPTLVPGAVPTATVPKFRRPEKKAKRRKRAPSRVEALPPKADRTTFRGGRKLPQARTLTPEEMREALARVAVGQPRPLEVGMHLVRKKRDGSGEIIVSIRANGFEMDGVLYPSLSACAINAERRSVSGNAFFSVATNCCTEIRASDGSVIATKSRL